MRPALAAVLVLTGALAAGSGTTSAAETPAVATCAQPSATGGWALGVERLSDPCVAELRDTGSSWR